MRPTDTKRVAFKKRKNEKVGYKPRIVQDTAWKQKLNRALSTVPVPYLAAYPCERSELEIFLRQSEPSPNGGGRPLSRLLSASMLLSLDPQSLALNGGEVSLVSKLCPCGPQVTVTASVRCPSRQMLRGCPQLPQAHSRPFGPEGDFGSWHHS